MTSEHPKEKKLPRWYFGGLASAGAAACTHPLDLLKVLLQTQQEKQMSIVKMTVHIVKKQGVLALYNGLSASILRQLTYSTTRFGIYEAIKQKWNTQMDAFAFKVAAATLAGAIGGFVGTPADLVNVRMQNDIKLPLDQRRNYKHALDGLIRVFQEEGLRRCFSGASAASSRAVMMTVGQLSFYDTIKAALLKTGIFGDNTTTHFLSSLCAGVVAVILTQPIDVVKTRMMNSPPGQFKNIFQCIGHTAKLGPLAFYKGTTPSAVRVLPGTILLFLFYEDLIYYFGYYPTKKKTDI